jgi:hypothetical protein
MILIRLVILIAHLYLSGVWLELDLKTDTKKDIFNKHIGLHAQNMFTILGSIINIIDGAT